VSAPACVDKVDRDLGVLDSPGGAGVLALNADSMDALLHVPGLVDHQHGLLVIEMVHDVVADIVAYRVGIPGGPAQQMLHPVWGLLPDPLGDRGRRIVAAGRVETLNACGAPERRAHVPAQRVEAASPRKGQTTQAGTPGR
jgi:hypothetical protein